MKRFFRCWSRKTAYEPVPLEPVPIAATEPEPEPPVRQSVHPKHLQRIELFGDITHQTAIAFDAVTNRLAVASTDNSTIDIMDVRTGERMQRLGGRGVEPGQFWSPSALAFDATGRGTLLVGERNGGERVQDMQIETKRCVRAWVTEGGVSALAANRIVIAVGHVVAAPDGTSVQLLCAYSFMPLHRIGAKVLHGLPVTSCVAVALDISGPTRVWIAEAAGPRVHIFAAFTYDGRIQERLLHDALVTQATFLSTHVMIVADNVSAGVHCFRRHSAHEPFELYTSLYAPQLGMSGIAAPVFLCNAAARPDVLWISDASYTRRRCLALHEVRFPEF